MLTPAGELLLNQVKPLLKAFAYVETRAATLRSGMRTRIDLMVDSIFPRSRLFAILRQFQQLYPQTQVRLTEVLENSRADALNDEADVMVLTRRRHYRPGRMADEYRFCCRRASRSPAVCAGYTA